jgi:hypothetical protein
VRWGIPAVSRTKPTSCFHALFPSLRARGRESKGPRSRPRRAREGSPSSAIRAAARQSPELSPTTPFRALLAEFLVRAAVLASEPPQHGPDLRSFVGRIVEVGCTEPPFALARHRKRLLSERTAVRIWLSVFPSGE